MCGFYVFADAHYSISFVITKQSGTHQQMINSLTNSLEEFLAISKPRSIIEIILMYKLSNVSLSQYYNQEKKEEIWLSPMTKPPTPTEMWKRAKCQHKQRHKKVQLHSGCGPT